MGKLIHLSEEDTPVHKTAEYLRHFGISYCPFAEQGGAQEFWHKQSLENVRAQLKETMEQPGLLVVSEPRSKMGSPTRALIMDVLNEDYILASLDALPDTPEQLLVEILTSFGFESIEADLSECRSVMQAFLAHSAASGAEPAVILHQAEPASEAVADEIGRLLNMRESGHPCVKLVMMGRPEDINLGDVKYDDLPISHIELSALDKEEVGNYIFDRLNESGLKGRSLITPAAIAQIAKVSGGIPGLIRQTCAVAMNHAYQEGKEKVTKAVLLEALKSYEFLLPERAVEDIVVDCIDSDVLEKGQREASSQNGDSGQPEVEEDGNDESENWPYFDMSREGKHISRFRLDGGRLTIGRHKSNEIYVPSGGVSLFHAVVICEKNEAYIFDLRSTNGTSVNGRDITRKRLSRGDTIDFGALRLVYYPGSDSAGRKVSNILSFAETVVLEEDEAAEPTVYFRSGV